MSDLLDRVAGAGVEGRQARADAPAAHPHSSRGIRSPLSRLGYCPSHPPWHWLLAFFSAVMASSPVLAQDESPPRITVGSKAFTESVILGELVSQLAERGGAEATHRAGLGGTPVVWNALRAGDVDIYPDYTGTIARELFAGRDLNTLADIRRELAPLGVSVSDSLGFADNYALGMTEARAAELNVAAISDLRRHPHLRFGFSPEFLERADGWPGLRDAYRLPQSDVSGLAHELAYRGLTGGSLDLIELYTTDAQIGRLNLRVLRDDRRFFTEYDTVLLYRTDLAGRAGPALRSILRLQGAIDEPTMIDLNAAADLDGTAERVVAGRFLADRFGGAQPRAAPSRWRRIAARTAEHLWLVGTSVALAILTAVPLGVWAAKKPSAGRLLLSGVGLLQTVPSLALFVFLIPVLGLGPAPAIAALFLYSLLPIVRGTHAGLAGIPAGVHESALALGLPAWTRLRRIELPLAARSAFSGVKTAVVINVGTATLGGFIAAGGYGQPIFSGLRRDDMGLVLEGAVPAAAMALLAQWAFDLLEVWTVPKGLRS